MIKWLAVQNGTGQILVSNSPSKNLEFEKSNITFDAGAQTRLSNGNVRMIENQFEGKGTIKMTITLTQQRSTQVLNNTFDGVHLEFIQPPNKAIVLRNNIFKRNSSFDNGALLQHCDIGDAKTGQGAGCDPRAECTEPVGRGDVQCKCTGRLKASAYDGSKCELDGKYLDIFKQQRNIQVRVRKPKSLTVQFRVKAQSERSFQVAVHSSAPEYLVVDSQRQYDMSPAKSEETQDLNFTLLGNKMNWSDSNEKTAYITVHPQDDTSSEIAEGVEL